MSDDIYRLCERLVVANHVRNHAGINSPNFAECRDGFCGDWRKAQEQTRAPHPAVEVLDELERWLVEFEQSRQNMRTGVIVKSIPLSKLQELRAAKGV